jgi:ABC-type transporter Mla subunit MlaD
MEIDSPAPPGAQVALFDPTTWGNIPTAISECCQSCSDYNLAERVTASWEFSAIFLVAVLCITQAVIAVFAGMLGVALNSALAGMTLLYAANFMESHSLVQELKERNAEQQQQIDQVREVSQRLQGQLATFGDQNTRVEASAGKLDNSATTFATLGERFVGHLAELSDFKKDSAGFLAKQYALVEQVRADMRKAEIERDAVRTEREQLKQDAAAEAARLKAIRDQISTRTAELGRMSERLDNSVSGAQRTLQNQSDVINTAATAARTLLPQQPQGSAPFQSPGKVNAPTHTLDIRA